MKKCFFPKTLSKHGKNRCFRHLGVKSWYWEDRYAIIFHRRDWPERPHGIDFFEKSWISKNRNQKNDKICPKVGWNGLRTIIRGSREVRKGQNCAPDAMEALPDPKNPFKNKKKDQKPLKSGKSRIFGIFPIFPVWAALYNSRSTAVAAAILPVRGTPALWHPLPHRR